ncbi:hypothetical protein F3Y22_tig00111377pilonHSYRG00081 [Hibiscus syriacus]|uniref:Late embryogenesis abundant protein LEA-2 subgroup domain-containing protein n=1 Tax=Hibiscus syriacus TaxID=106335 RepID=A0A6A2YMT8_HIBSY|nr:hypothetical protein F3Y22_tig00111377pilonHSYRG00081 [Hibiscus syriacus]
MVLYLFLLFLLPRFFFGAPLDVRPREVSVSELDVSGQKLTLNLSTTYAVHNPNKAFRVRVKSTRGTLYCRNIDPLAVTTVLKSFYLEEDGVVFGMFRFSSGDGSDGERSATVERDVIEDISPGFENRGG